jgi:hypothetical protein
MPITTTFQAAVRSGLLGASRSGSDGPCSLITVATWPRISQGLRFLRYPLIPVRQKAQRRGQPAWVEMQMVRRRVSGMKTLSTLAPSSRRKRYLTLPSREQLRSTTSGQRSSNASESLPRSSFLRLVMEVIERTRFLYSQW